MKKLFVFFFFLVSLFAIHYSLFTREALAHCPLCVAGAGVGLSLARIIGVDDTITGVWIAGLLGAISFWTYTAVSKRKIFFLLKPLVYIVIFATTIWSFYKFRLIFRMVQVFGMDKLTFGMTVGGIAFYLIDLLDDLIIIKRGKVFFPYQRIVVSLGSMVALSLAMYVLVNYFI